ncbi:MAG: AAA family ATPase [Candidatus Poribacteria bacterium]
MYRTFTEHLKKWKNSKNRLPLLLRGARQTGKTWLVRNHAESYHDFFEINFEADPEYASLFKEKFGNPDELLRYYF